VSGSLFTFLPFLLYKHPPPLPISSVITPAMVSFISSDPNTPIATYAGTFDPPNDEPFPIYVPTDVLACGPIDADLTGKVTLVQRGTCTFADKANNVLNAGGRSSLLSDRIALLSIR
jgi:hypothetical protein